MKPLIVANNGHLDAERRTTLASAYKHIINGLRSRHNPPQLPSQGVQTSAVAFEIGRVCNEIIDLLREWLIPAAAVGEESVFYWKLSVLVPSNVSSPPLTKQNQVRRFLPILVRYDWFGGSRKYLISSI
jgi:hypothetical protein